MTPDPSGAAFSSGEEAARDLDRSDPLAPFRSRFHLPPGVVYMDGNSLGLCSLDAEDSLRGVLEEWKSMGVAGWLDGRPPWFFMAERAGEAAAPIVGALPEELVLTGTTTFNIHALAAALYRPAGRRTRILADALAFPTDVYALKGQIRLRGLDPDRELVLVGSPDGRMLDEAAIEAAMTEEVALALLPSVLYRSGQLLDMAYLAAAARRRGVLIGFDCSHSAGVVPHRLHDWGTDFAVFCGYKYLNGGPGCAAFLFLHERHFGTEPLLAGWFGSRKDRQFDMALDFDPEPTARGFQVSSPGILGTSPLLGALRVTREAGIEAIRDKSLRMTSYFMFLLRQGLTEPPYDFSIGTPLEPARRGGHVAVEHPREALRISLALKARGVVPDFRPPNVIRFAPIPLYNTYHEVWRVANHLREIIDGREYERFSPERGAIT